MKATPCGDNAECLNRILRIECDPKSCPAKDRCENRRFQKRVYPPMEVIKCDKFIELYELMIITY